MTAGTDAAADRRHTATLATRRLRDRAGRNDYPSVCGGWVESASLGDAEVVGCRGLLWVACVFSCAQYGEKGTTDG